MADVAVMITGRRLVDEEKGAVSVEVRSSDGEGGKMTVDLNGEALSMELRMVVPAALMPV